MGGDASEVGDPDAPQAVDRQALLTALTTEHFTLAGARGTTVSESAARAALFVGALSSTLIAIGFMAQVSDLGTAFDVFVLVVLPTLYVLGTITFVRLVGLSIEDVRYGRAINRIRHYYLELAGPEAYRFAMSAHDDMRGVLRNMGIDRPSRWQLYFTLAMMVAVLTAVVGGTTVAFVAGVAGAPLGAAVPVGAVAAAASFAAATHWQQRAHTRARMALDVRFPSPPDGR